MQALCIIKQSDGWCTGEKRGYFPAKSYKKTRLLSRDRQSSEQFAGLNRRDDEMQAEFALVPLTISDTSQEEAL